MSEEGMVAVADDGAAPRSRNRRSKLPAAVDLPRSYAAGPLRAVTDHERARVESLVAAHPEFERLGYEPLRQVAASWLDDADLATRGELRAAGVRIGYHRAQTDDVNPTWSDEQ